MSISQCPYAVALSEDEASHSLEHHHQQSPTGSKNMLTAELSQCPAFAVGQGESNKTTCPFKEAKSPEEIQQRLAQIPPSHYTQKQSGFLQVLQHLHQVHEQGGDAGFASSKILQGCPMKPYVPADNNAFKPQGFTQAMEECSLAAIMARLAADMEDSSEHSGDSEDVSPRNSEVSLLAKSMAEENQSSKQQEGLLNNDSMAEEHDNSAPKRNSLAEALKTGTAVSHQAAEDVHFVRNFIRGQIDRHLYQEMILDLYHVYVALEDALDVHAPTVFPSCHFPEELARRETLEEDCEFWHNTRTPSPRTISPETQDYIDRIQYLAHHDPLLLLAHSYTRYLGDLSGGRILARVARRALDLDKKSMEGLAFYRFENVKSYKEFKDNYRQALDALPLTGDQIKALVAEANVAFCLNMRLFQALDATATIPGARVMRMEEVMEYADKSTNTVDNPAEDQCPFLVNKKKEQQQQQQQPQQMAKQGGRCPWPFVFAHDPWQGVKDWQTWLVVALLIAWFKVF